MSRGNRYELSLNPSHVGQRVMIRRVLNDSGDQTDLVGPLIDWRGDTLTMSALDGSTVDIAVHSMIAGKPVPPAPRFRSTVATPELTSDEELERVALLGWRALHAQWAQGWLLRDGGGFTGRANSALPLGKGPGLAAVVAWYRSRGLDPQVQVPLPLCADLDDELDAAGWEAHNRTSVMTARTQALADAVGDPVRVDLAPDEPWLAAYHYRGGHLPPAGRTILRAAQKPGFASIRDASGSVLAIARAACDLGWVGLSAIEVDSAHRRQGLGSQIVTGVSEWALRQGAANVYLQVAHDNTGAIALYESLGFTHHHSYQYRVLRRPS